MLWLFALLSVFASQVVCEGSTTLDSFGIPTAKEQQAEAKATNRSTQVAESGYRKSLLDLGTGADGDRDEPHLALLALPPPTPVVVVVASDTLHATESARARLRPLQSSPHAPRAPPAHT